MKRTLTLIASALVCAGALAQGTLADYQRAYGIRSAYEGKTTNIVGNNVQLTADESQVIYSVTTKNSNDYYVIDLKKNKKSPLFDSSKLAAALSEQSGRTITARNLNFASLTPKQEGGTTVVEFDAAGYHWSYTPATNQLTRGEQLQQPEGGRNMRGQQGGQQRRWSEVDDQRGRTARFGNQLQVYGRDNNLYIRNNETGEESALTTDGNEQFYYSSWGSFSTDGKYYATVKIKPGIKRYVTYVNSSPTDQLQPKYYNIEYAKPGDSLDYQVPVVINMETREMLVPDDALFHSQFEL